MGANNPWAVFGYKIVENLHHEDRHQRKICLLVADFRFFNINDTAGYFSAEGNYLPERGI